jgi:16S rRNA A1518/A1519 N6-dimethyltransferase RsmA/KsgA/DIM1 with predicted DNA glycosylase/AP lyase activity
MKLESITFGNIVRKIEMLLNYIHGLDFLRVVLSEDVGLDPTLSYRSSPSGDKYLKKLLFDLNISSKDSIMDIGCGKGSAMRVMLKFPFSHVDGIELSEDIAKIAKRNFEKLREYRSTIYIGDASEFTNFDLYNIVYFYNPFPSSVMVKVINELKESIHRNDRELVIIYNNATCNDIVVGQNFFVKMGGI